MNWKTTLALLASCGLTSAAAAQDADPMRIAPYQTDQQELRHMSSAEHGRYVATADGHALYVLTRDRQSRSKCYGSCARAWPPLLVSQGDVMATQGIDPDLVGALERDDGTLQVTYAGWPLYHYVHDDDPGQTEGHEVHDRWGEWLLLSPTGQPKYDGADRYERTGFEDEATDPDADVY